jgi:hypothetical protein
MQMKPCLLLGNYSARKTHTKPATLTVVNVVSIWPTPLDSLDSTL